MPSLVDIFSHYINVYPEIVVVRIRNSAGSDVLNVPEETDLTVKNIKIDTTSLHSDTTSFVYPDEKQPFFIHTIKLYYPTDSTVSKKSLFGYLGYYLVNVRH